MSPEAVRYCGRLFSEQEMRLRAIRQRRATPAAIGSPSAGGVRTAPLAACQRTTEGHELPGGDAARDDPAAGAAPAPLQRHPAPPSHPAGGTGVADHRPRDALPGCRYDRSPISAKRSCGASTWTATHYLGYTPRREHRCATLVTSQRRVLAVVGFGASAWKAAPRDRFIGWSVAQREAGLQLVVNNAQLPDLALGAGAQSRFHGAGSQPAAGLPDDWQDRYGYRPLLLETFVQPTASPGYRAANWTHVGQTQGRGKLDVHRTHPLPRKDIWYLPAQADFRRRLCAPLDPHPNQ